MTTYVAMIAMLAYTIYFSVVQFDWKRAGVSGLVTVLIAYINRVNPK
jgi:hypothetical protein